MSEWGKELFSLQSASVIISPVVLRSQTFEVVSEILKANCSGCHSAQSKASDFSVATLATVVAGGKKHGKAVVGGHPDKSPLIQIIKGEIAPRMPMGKALGSEDVAKLGVDS